MTTAKNKVFIGLLLEYCCLVGELTFDGEWKFDEEEVYRGDKTCDVEC